MATTKTAAVKSAARRSAAPTPTLKRTTFRTNREMDFLSEKDLTAQTGHEREEWAYVFLKETVDNALDACEDANIAPVIEIEADAAGITVRDNGPGLPESTLAGALDFSVRASSREAYVSPTRGAQGNALMTLFPMAKILDDKDGRIIVTANGRRHVITCGVDQISGRAVIYDDPSDAPCRCEKVKTDAPDGTEKPWFNGGTEIRIQWAPQDIKVVRSSKHIGNGSVSDERRPTWPFYPHSSVNVAHRDQFRQMVAGFSLFNPHATIRLTWFGDLTEWRATDPAWKKWKPCWPTSSHWYEQRHIDRLAAAYVSYDRQEGEDRLVSDVLAEFDGFSGSKKRSAVLDETDLKRVHLSELVTRDPQGGDRIDSTRTAALLAAMQRHSKPVKSKYLGVIGEAHFRQRFIDMGVRPESFRYSKKLAKDGLPWVLESAFGWLGDDASDFRQIYSGANWSAAIKNPFRSFGSTGTGLEAALTEMKAGATEPIVFALHLAHPRVEYTDRGKSALIVAAGNGRSA